MNARNIVISREQAETIIDQETCDRLFAAGTDVRQVENACFRLGCLHQAESMLAASRKSFDAGSGYSENLSREDIMRLYDELRQKLRKAQQRALDELDELEGAS